MRRSCRARAVLAAVLLAGTPAGTGAEVLASEPVITVRTDDAEMNAAMARARASLDVFWRQCKKPDVDVSHLSLKVRIRDGENTEHFWLVDVKCQGDALSGVIDNDPELVKNVKIGQRYAFAEGDISDWMYLHNGKMVGNETLRVLIKRMPADQAAQYQEIFEEP